MPKSNVHVMTPKGKIEHFAFHSPFKFDDLRDQLSPLLDADFSSRLTGLIELDKTFTQYENKNVKRLGGDSETIWRPGDDIKLSGETWFAFHQDTSFWHAKVITYMSKLVCDGIPILFPISRILKIFLQGSLG